MCLMFSVMDVVNADDTTALTSPLIVILYIYFKGQYVNSFSIVNVLEILKSYYQ